MRIKLFRLLLVPIVFLVATSAPSYSQNLNPPPRININPAQIAIAISATSQSSIPFEPVQFHLTVHNKHTEKITSVGSPEEHPELIVQQVGQKFFRAAPVLLETSEPRPTSATFVDRAAGIQLDLEPGDSVRVTYCCALEKNEDRSLSPLFTRPVTYRVRAKYLIHSGKAQYIHAETEVHIQEPKGDDLKVFQILSKDPALVVQIMHPIDAPKKETLKAIQVVIEEYPKSTYTPYAQFAIARYHYFQEDEASKEKSIDIFKKIVDLEFGYKEDARAFYWELMDRPEDLTKKYNKEMPEAIAWLDRAMLVFTKKAQWQEFRVRKAEKKE